MSGRDIDATLRLAGYLTAAGLTVQLISFFWNHPLAFIAFAGVGGTLVGGGVLVFLWVTVRETHH